MSASAGARQRPPVIHSAENIDAILDGGHDAFADREVYQYIRNILRSTKPTSDFASRLCLAAEKHLDDIDNFPSQPPPVRRVKKAKSSNDENAETGHYYDLVKGKCQKVVPEDWETLKKHIDKELKAIPASEPDPFYKNISKLSGYLGLDEINREVLQLITVFAKCGYMDFFLSAAAPRVDQVAAVVARALNRQADIKKIADALSPAGPLMSCGLIVDCGDFLPEIERSLWESLSHPDMDKDSIVKSFLGVPVQTELNIGDFSYLGSDLQSMLELLEAAVARGEKGINVILYGPPGSGKTELAKAIAAAIGKNLYSVGEDGSDADSSFDTDSDEGPVTVNVKNDRSSSQVRMAQLQRAQAILKGNPDSVLLFDEIEDLLIKGTDSSKSSDVDSKIVLNRLLENNPVVTIWTGNDPEKFHPAVRQRFAYALHVGYPPTLVRAKIWQRQMDMQKVTIPSDDVLELARKYDVPPRMIFKAVRHAALTAGGRRGIEQFIAADSHLSLGHREATLNPVSLPEGYKPSLSVTADGIKAVDELIALSEARLPYSLLVRGSSGTGSSYLMHHIAEKSMQTVMEVSMGYLAQPEQMATPAAKIQGVFSAAANSRSFLVIHNIEELSENPGSENGNWNGELMPVFMEAAHRHNLPFAVTTESEAEIPEFFRSRFSHNLELKPFDRGQAREAYAIFFGGEPPATIDKVDNLVISDFEGVRRWAEHCRPGHYPDGEQLMALLKKYKKLRLEGQAGPTFGFPGTKKPA